MRFIYIFCISFFKISCHNTLYTDHVIEYTRAQYLKYTSCILQSIILFIYEKKFNFKIEKHNEIQPAIKYKSELFVDEK